MYTIGEIEELTGVKSHTLRYWETVIPGFSPQKDIGGRRIYTQRELEIVMRLKFLIQEKKFTIEGAREQIISEVDLIAENATLLKQIHDLRKDLTDLYMCVKKYERKSE
jgi:DNA-binding transcriptional MerR regulator